MNEMEQSNPVNGGNLPQSEHHLPPSEHHLPPSEHHIPPSEHHLLPEKHGTTYTLHQMTTDAAVIGSNSITIISYQQADEPLTHAELNGLDMTVNGQPRTVKLDPLEPANSLVTDIGHVTDGFWEEFLEQCRAFENCTIVCSDGQFRTHKLLLSNNAFIKYLLSSEDPGDESVLLLPDFTLAEVKLALDYNAVGESDLTSLLNRCYSSVEHHTVNKRENPSANSGNPVLPAKPELVEINCTLGENSDRFAKYLTSDGRFQCDNCEKAFNSIRFLYKHLKNYHDVDNIFNDNDRKQSKKSAKRRRGRSKVKKEFEDFIDDDDDDEEEDFEDESFDEEDDDGDLDDNQPAKSAREKKRARKTRSSAAEDAGDKTCICKFCGRGFAIQKYLDSHITNKHPEKSEINTFIVEDDGVYKCMLCQKTFSIARRCRYHLKFKHKIGAKFQCSECDKMFYYEYDLELHKRFHSAKKNFVCDLCGKGFLLEHVLQTHKQNMHTSREEKEKTRKFVCSFCAKGFFSKSALQEHEFLHSEKKNFHCDMCGFSFKQSSGLRAHNNRHHSITGPKPITEEHKEKMRAYMKRYRAMKAGKLPDSINHSFRSPRKTTSAHSSSVVNAASANPGQPKQQQAAMLISTTAPVTTVSVAGNQEFIAPPDITLQQIAYKTEYPTRGGVPPQKLGTRGGVFYIN